ncbi:MAG: hypothetical protein ACD_18C00031G0002 [uncultured bacterium]|nr:MAG: hypothetical protein ACD_18C00031G0002 [uncultured bacterium]
MEEERFTHLTFNFHNLQYGIESFVVIALVFLSTVYILKFSKSFQNDRQKNTYKTAWLLAFIINTPVTLLATRAQEARIMALPLVLIWPYIGKYIFELLKEFESQTKDYLQKWKKTNNIPLLLINLLSVISILALCYLFILKVYTPGLNGFHRGYKIYALITVSILSIHYLIIKKQN